MKHDRESVYEVSERLVELEEFDNSKHPDKAHQIDTCLLLHKKESPDDNGLFECFFFQKPTELGSIYLSPWPGTTLNCNYQNSP